MRGIGLVDHSPETAKCCRINPNHSSLEYLGIETNQSRFRADVMKKNNISYIMGIQTMVYKPMCVGSEKFFAFGPLGQIAKSK